MSFDTIYNALDVDKSIAKDRDYFIIACSRGQGSFRPGTGKGRGENAAITMDRKSDILFGNSKDTDHFLNPYRYDKAIPKPVFACSDAHKLDDIGIKYTWVKADTTFMGLQQAVYHPSERVYIGAIPPKLDKVNQNKSAYIKSIFIRTDNKSVKHIWFDCEIFLNPGLIAIIGNKGSGKSALSDIIGHLCQCKTINDYASFLNCNRFRKSPEKLANEYNGSLKWTDDKSQSQTLAEVNYDTTIEGAQYLPQKYIEKVCNDLNDEFQQEIDNVIFSYIDVTEKDGAKNLKELISRKSKVFESKILEIKEELREINRSIVECESRLIPSYKKTIDEDLKKRKSDLERHLTNKPKEVIKPKETEDVEYTKKLEGVNSNILKLQKSIDTNRALLKDINEKMQKAKDLKEKAINIIDSIDKFNMFLDFVIKDLALEKETFNIKCFFSTETITSIIDPLEKKKQDLLVLLRSVDQDIEKKSLCSQKKEFEKKRTDLISTADIKEKEYQKYLQDLEKWELLKKNILGDDKTLNTISYLESEIKNVAEIYPSEYEELKASRIKKIKEIYNQKRKKADVYVELYKPIETTIEKILGKSKENIRFEINFLFKDKNIITKIMDSTNLRISGKFQGKEKASNTLTALIKQTDCNDVVSVEKFFNEILSDIYDDLENSSKKISNKEDYYNLLSSLDYIDIEYNLRMGATTLEELSPGEKGMLLLVFYLALNKGESPLIIDQPEDNLDNQSIFRTLVPVICEAKKRRQVIIVTHNPNIAIACDAEQIIYSHMDKINNKITCESGSIENPKMLEHIMDVLEGTVPAFDLRTLKYLLRNRV
ncbi:MAG: AAA family ATPase [Endomicrobium sp.]|nr:AAA family ATPase [Endomicrobium sp.]